MFTDRPACAGSGLAVYTKFCTPSDYSNFSENEKREFAAVGDIRGYSLFNLGAQYRMNKNVTFSATIYNLFDKDFLKFKKWRELTYNTAGAVTGERDAWANSYVKSSQSTKGSIPDGRTLWIRANVQF